MGLDLEPRKTALVEFSRSGYIDRQLNIRIDGCDVPNCGGAKFLGIWLDNKLSFERQIHELRGKVNRANSIIRYLCGVSRGMEVNTSLMLYKSLVKSIIDYGSFVFFPRKASLQLKLERAQFLGIRTALGYRNSTPNNVIVAEAKVTYLKDRAMLLGFNFANKAIAHNQNGLCDKMRALYEGENFVRYRQPTYGSSLLSEIWKRVNRTKHLIGPVEKFPVFSGSYSAHTFIPTVDIDVGAGRRRESFSDCYLIQKIISKYHLGPNPDIFFTDGSCREAAVSTGASIVICDQEEAFKISLPGLCSSYTAEAFAINCSALHLLWTRKYVGGSEIIILSDCQAVLKSINNNHLNIHKNKYVTEARILIYKLEKFCDKKIVLVWIPAHAGILGNEIADGLAKEATEEEADPTIAVPVGDLLAHAIKEAWESTQVSIARDALHKGAFYFEKFYDRASSVPWFRKVRAERYFVTFINRLRANHYNLGASLKRKRSSV
ncbi:uncharacterized protein LOC112466452 [Temnothorax curvispinosus]|uniref:ribonuclease H n=1 Tax=Temnothorax curvispinosus TaxID=300111 RepID=A0A6J1R5M4_9HYME|nr:uncharacterized protein LOC112466452 [Temnothorax curvispinosus]